MQNVTLTRRRFLTTSAAALAAGGLARTTIGQQSRDFERTGDALITPETQAAVDRGLAFLAAAQLEDGSFGTGGYARDVAICGLSGMAFMSGGSTPGRGPYGAHLEKCIDFILANTGDSGFIYVPGATSHGPMYGHGFASLFLSECYGMTMRPDIRDKLSKAITLITQTQNKEGGWRYQPRRHEADISVTVCQVMALRAARNAGLFVPTEVIDNSIQYVKRCQNADGGFMYMAQGGLSAFPRSAAGIVALYSAGIYEGPEIERGLEYLTKPEHFPREGQALRESHYFYGHYYAIQAMWHAGGEHWTRWYPAIRGELLHRVKDSDDGAWMDSICQEYGTAMACIVLQMPNNYLPIFQR